MWTARFAKLRHSKAAYAIISTLPSLLAIIALMASHAPGTVYMLVGGSLGSIYSLLVIAHHYLSKDNGPPLALLFWRSVSDLGLASRFLAMNAFNYALCNQATCLRSNSDEDRCTAPSVILQFFAMASEGWFFCIALDLYYSVTNPFSSFESRIKYYHMISWSFGAVYALFPLISAPLQKFLYGFFYINTLHDDMALCWVKLHSRNSNFVSVWIMFFIPVILIYIFSLSSLYIAYAKLKRGITRTFLPRMKLLVTNTANVLSLLCYLLLAALIYAWSFATYEKYYGTFVQSLLLFVFANKGFSAYFVLILISDNFLGNQMNDEGGVDANKALREEVLHFATAGIRSTCRTSSAATMDRKEIIRRPRALQAGTTNNITPTFFMRFVLGLHAEVQAVESMASTTRRSVDAAFRVTITADDRPEDWQAFRESDHHRATHAGVDEDVRMSQRPTVVMGATTVRTSIQRPSSGAFEAYARKDTRNSLRFGGDSVSEASSSESNKAKSRVSQIRESGASDATSAVDDSESEDNANRQGNRHTEDIFVASEVEPKHDNSGLVDNASCLSRLWNFLRLPSLDASENVEFTEFEPYHFRRIRYSLGVSDEQYAEFFSATIKERLTQGGASGAFFFFSKDERLIAKSCSKSELETLKDNAEAYADHLVRYKNSYISKIFGAYRLHIYGNDLNFFVMNNIFLNPEGLVMNEKYDIKGSWVARNAELPTDGQSATCKHCEQKFVFYKKKKFFGRKFSFSSSNQSKEASMLSQQSPLFPSSLSTLESEQKIESFDAMDGFRMKTGSSTLDGMEAGMSNNESRCPYTVTGLHEPNLILKDNDMKYKLRLPLDTSVTLLHQLTLDAEFLTRLGIMDYSLLIGVHNTEYEVSSSKSPNHPAMKPSGTSNPKLSEFSAVTEFSDESEDTKESDKGRQSPMPMLVRSISIPNKDSPTHSPPRQPSPPPLPRPADGHQSLQNGDATTFVGVNPTIDPLKGSNVQPFSIDNSGKHDSVDFNQWDSSKATPNRGSFFSSMLGMSSRTSAGTMPSDINVVSLSPPALVVGQHSSLEVSRKLEVMRVVGPDAYFMGIIDFQQSWTFQKRCERFFKINFRGADPDGLSAIEPSSYKERFLRKIEDLLDFESFQRSVSTGRRNTMI